MNKWSILGTKVLVALGLGPACLPKGDAQVVQAEPARSNDSTAEVTPAAEVTASSSGLLDVNGIQMWHEVYGDGPPVFVVHGGLMTIPEMMPIITPLAKQRKVVAIELQGHGRSPDTNREMSIDTSADDVAATIDALKLGPTDLVGYSYGGATALRAAIRYPAKVRRLAVISNPCAHRGWYPEARQGMASVGASMAEALKDTPTARFAQQWPEPKRFPQFLDKLGKALGKDYDWCADAAKLPMPVLLVYADHDSIAQRHITEFFAVLGGGITEPGWQNTKFTKARLAVIPGYSHYNLMTSTELPPIVEKFLASSLANTGGAAAASESAP